MALLKYSTNLELRDRLKSSNHLSSVKDVMTTTPPKTALGLHREETVARPIILKIYAWPQLNVEIVGVHIALIVANVLPGQHALVHLPKNN